MSRQHSCPRDLTSPFARLGPYPDLHRQLHSDHPDPPHRVGPKAVEWIGFRSAIGNGASRGSCRQGRPSLSKRLAQKRMNAKSGLRGRSLPEWASHSRPARRGFARLVVGIRIETDLAHPVRDHLDRRTASREDEVVRLVLVAHRIVGHVRVRFVLAHDLGDQPAEFLVARVRPAFRAQAIQADRPA